MDQLIKAGVDPNSWDCEDKRNSVLHWAVSFGTVDSVSYLIGLLDKSHVYFLKFLTV